MATPRCDHSLPAYLQQTGLANGATLTGPPTLLNGCLALNLHVISANGCTGTLYLDGTNQDAGQINWVTPTTQACAANQQLVLSYSLEDNITSMHRFRIRFVASAPGDIIIAVNLRHTTR
jgi:hypothetical protein